MTLIKNAIYLAWMDTRARYKKSVLGPFWLTLGSLIGVLGLSVVWANLLQEDLKTFVPSLTLGLVIWQLIAGTIGDGPSTFVRQSAMIRNVAIPHWFFVLRALSRQIINLLHNLVIVVGVVVYFKLPLGAHTWLALPGLLLLIANLFWVTYILGMLGARFRDIEYLTHALLPILFFISPVIFRTHRLPLDLQIIWLNPLSHFIEIVREPFLTTAPSYASFLICLGVLCAGSMLTLLLIRLRGRQLAFWV